MSGSLNRVCLIGNFGRDPESRNTNFGTVVNFSLATAESWKDKNSGEKRERTDWHNVVCYNEGLGGVITRYCKKGSKVYIEGKLRTRKYTDKDGADRYTTEVIVDNFDGKLVLLTPKQSGDDNRDDDRDRDQNAFGRRPATVGGGRGSLSDDLDDSIPF